MIKQAAAVFAGLAGVYAMSTLAARLAFRRILFAIPDATGDCPEDARLLALRARDGAVVHAIEVPANARGTVVYFHGNGETAANVVPLARMLADEGLAVFVLEYRGYGLSQQAGSPSETALYADAEALLDHLVGERGIAPGSIALWGASLGSAVAVEMARRVSVGALVLVSPFTSVRALCRDHLPILPPGFVVRDAFDSLAKAGELSVPTVVLHGDADRRVPVAMGRALAAAIRGARYVVLEGAGHLVLATHGDDVVREVVAHLKSAGVASSG